MKKPLFIIITLVSLVLSFAPGEIIWQVLCRERPGEEIFYMPGELYGFHKALVPLRHTSEAPDDIRFQIDFEKATIITHDIIGKNVCILCVVNMGLINISPTPFLPGIYIEADYFLFVSIIVMALLALIVFYLLFFRNKPHIYIPLAMLSGVLIGSGDTHLTCKPFI